MRTEDYLNMIVIVFFIMETIKAGFRKMGSRRLSSHSGIYSLLTFFIPLYGGVATYYFHVVEGDSIADFVITLIVVALAAAVIYLTTRKKTYTLEGVTRERFHQLFSDLLNHYGLKHSKEKEYSNYEIRFLDEGIRSQITLKEGSIFSKSHTISVTHHRDIPELRDILAELDEELSHEPLKYAYVKGLSYIFLGSLMTIGYMWFILYPQEVLRFLFG